MPNVMKKHEFFLPFARHFTRGADDAFDDIPFQSSDFAGDEASPALASPLTWSAESVEIMAEAAHRNVPADLSAIEENTVPSWLWRHHGPNHNARCEQESDLRDIFNRAVGSATAKAWKLGFFTSEKHARSFYDELRYAFAQRHIAVAPDVIAPWGLSWAYGLDEFQKPSHAIPADAPQISNAAIDAVLGKPKSAGKAPLWKKLFAARGPGLSSASVRFSDIAAEWLSPAPSPARAAIDVFALRRDDGRVDIDALRQTARMLSILLDLQERTDVTVGIANLAPLLMASGLAYDSDAARALAASLIALVTAECAAASAEMAALRGMSSSFSANRDGILRVLRNHRRAVYGDGNDYEKLSVLPAPLPLKNCPDLALVSAAQRRWDEALDMARAFGLRATQFTDLSPSPVLAILMECASQGLEPMARLTSLKSDDSGAPRTTLHPAVEEAFERMDYPDDDALAAALNIVGHASLLKAPRVNAASLKTRGIGETAFEKIEAYLPCVGSIRLAVTPWIVGVDFCRDTLKIPAHKLDSLSFDLLAHLGFSNEDIDEADAYCYGFGTARSAKSIPLRDRPLFACGDEISQDARLRMAAAVQSFVSGDTGVTLRLPLAQSVEAGAEAALSAWRGGLKSLTLVFDPALAPKTAAKTKARRIKVSAHPLAKPVLPSRQSKTRKHGATVLSARKSGGTRRGAR